MIDKNSVKGMRFENLVSSVFQSQGYLVRRGVPLKYGNAGLDATDIDVLGIKFTQPFQPHKIICDCKDKQRSKPYERIFWAKGLSSFVDASETYVALPKTSPEIIKFARTGQVRIVTEEVLQEFLNKGLVFGRRGYGLTTESFYEPFFERIATIIKKEAEADRIITQTKTLFIVDDPYVTLNIVMSNFNISTDAIKKTLDAQPKEYFDLWKFILADLTVLFSLLLLYIASDTVSLLKQEREKYILDRITFGDISPKKATELFDFAKKLSIESAKALVPNATQDAFKAFDIGKIEPPKYAYDVVGLVERVIASPYLYHELPQLVDFLLFEQSLPSGSFSEEDYKIMFPSSHQEERLKVVRNVFSFLGNNVGLDPKIFWPKQDGNLPRTTVT